MALDEKLSEDNFVMLETEIKKILLMKELCLE
jgi:hypothetical protein